MMPKVIHKEFGLMAYNAELWERSQKATLLVIGDHLANGWEVKVSDGGTQVGDLEFEMHLGLDILLFEMEQCGINLTAETAIPFVQKDIQKFGARALEGYLNLCRHITHPPPRVPAGTVFARLFHRAPKWQPPEAKWIWATVSYVGREGDTVVIKGKGCAIR